MSHKKNLETKEALTSENVVFILALLGWKREDIENALKELGENLYDQHDLVAIQRLEDESGTIR